MPTHSHAPLRRHWRLACLLATAASLLAACTSTPAASATALAAPPVAETPVQSPLASPTAGLALELAKATETQVALSTQLSKAECLEEGGQIHMHQEPSAFLDYGLQFRVYTPPCYEASQQQYPVLYLIHGQTYNDDQWDRLGADETASALMAAGDLPPFLIVMPYDRSSNQPAQDPFGRAVIEELLPWVDANYRTLPERAYRAVGGLSRGASWAIHLGFKYPHLFSAVGGHSPPVFREDAPQMRSWLDEIPSQDIPRLWLDIGERDQQAIMNSAVWFEGLLTERSIAHEWFLFAGDHSEAYWSRHVERYLRWYAQDW